MFPPFDKKALTNPPTAPSLDDHGRYKLSPEHRQRYIGITAGLTCALLFACIWRICTIGFRKPKPPRISEQQRSPYRDLRQDLINSALGDDTSHAAVQDWVRGVIGHHLDSFAAEQERARNTHPIPRSYDPRRAPQKPTLPTTARTRGDSPRRQKVCLRLTAPTSTPRRPVFSNVKPVHAAMVPLSTLAAPVSRRPVPREVPNQPVTQPVTMPTGPPPAPELEEASCPVFPFSGGSNPGRARCSPSSGATTLVPSHRTSAATLCHDARQHLQRPSPNNAAVNSLHPVPGSPEDSDIESLQLPPPVYLASEQSLRYLPGRAST